MIDAYQNTDVTDAGGDPAENAENYWKNLKAIAADNIAEEDNNQVALLVYNNVVSQIDKKCDDIIKNGLATKQEILTELDRILKCVEKINPNQKLTEIKNDCIESIRVAKMDVESMG